jgi:pimeloyl-ACP methyl ester carboxylesterase
LYLTRHHAFRHAAPPGVRASPCAARQVARQVARRLVVRGPGASTFPAQPTHPAPPARHGRASPHALLEVHIHADLLRVPVGPGSLHVERSGHGGTAIVLLHGFGTSSFLWRGVAPRIAAAGQTAIAIDLLGYGESDRPIDADFGIAAQAEYLDRALTALRVARGMIVGVDVGGGVALRLALTRPERVERLVLVNTVAFDEFPARDVRTLPLKTARFAFRVTRGMFGAQPLLAPLLERSVADRDHMPPRLVARYLAPYVGQEGVGHLLALARALRAEEVEELDLAAVYAPTLVVWGEEDRWVDHRLPERLVNTIPESRLVRLPNVGRLVPEESPDRLAQLLLDFAVQPGTA